MECGVEWATARLVVLAGTGIYRQPGQRTAVWASSALGNLKTPRTYSACGLSLMPTPGLEYWLWYSESKRA